MSINVRKKTERLWWLPLLGLLLIAITFLPRVSSLDVFLAPDERQVWLWSNNFLMALLRGDLAGTASNAYPAVPLMWIEAAGTGAKYLFLLLSQGGPVDLMALIGPNRPFGLLPEKRLYLAVANALNVLVMGWLVNKVFGGKTALISVMLIALDPFLLAESRVVRVEALVSGFMVLSVLALIAYLYREDRRYLIASGALGGLAMLTQVPAGVLVPFCGGTLLVWCLWRGVGSWRARLLQWVRAALLWGGVAAGLFWALWPAMWVNPVGVWNMLADFATRRGLEETGGRLTFFWGQVFPEDPGPWFYPVALAFRMAPLVVLGVLIVFAILLVTSCRGVRRSLVSRPGVAATGTGPQTIWPSVPAPHLQANDSPLPLRYRDGPLPGALVLIAYALAIVAMMTRVTMKYDRYLLPIFPALDVVAAIGWVWLGEQVGAYLRSRLPGRLSQGWLAGLAAMGLLIVQGIDTLPHHPYYYTYYNSLLGGVAKAVQVLPVGVGEGIDQAMRHLNRQPNARQLKVACANSQKCEAIFVGTTFALDDIKAEWVQADYVLIYISQLQRDKDPPGLVNYLRRQPPEYVVRMHGIDYAWLYRGPAAQRLAECSDLEGRGTLFGYTLEPPFAAAGQPLHVKLYWQSDGPRPDDELYVRLVDAGGYEWARSATYPSPGFETSIGTRGTIIESEAEMELPVGMPPGQYFFKAGFYSRGQREVVGEFAFPAGQDDVLVSKPARPITAETIAMQHRVGARMGDDVLLLGYDLGAEEMNGLALVLYWQALQDVKTDYAVVVRLLDGQGKEADYWLGRPVRSGYPTTEWRKGDIVRDPWDLTMRQDLSVGTYDLEVELNDVATEVSAGKVRLGSVSVRER